MTKRTVAYRPAVSIRLSPGLGLSIFSQSAERAARAAPNGVKKGATFLLVFRCLNHTASSPKAFNGVQKGQGHSKKHKPSKKYFVDDRFRGHHPQALRYIVKSPMPMQGSSVQEKSQKCFFQD